MRRPSFVRNVCLLIFGILFSVLPNSRSVQAAGAPWAVITFTSIAGSAPQGAIHGMFKISLAASVSNAFNLIKVTGGGVAYEADVDRVLIYADGTGCDGSGGDGVFSSSTDFLLGYSGATGGATAAFDAGGATMRSDMYTDGGAGTGHINSTGLNCPPAVGMVSRDFFVAYEISAAATLTNTVTAQVLTSWLVSFTGDFSAGPSSDSVVATATVSSAGPTVTTSNISVSGTANGSTSGVGNGYFLVDDVIKVEWDNSVATGDGNVGVTAMNVNFSTLDGGASVAGSDGGGGTCDMTASDDIWTACYTLVAGALNTAAGAVTVTATDAVGTSTPVSSGGAGTPIKVDSIRPTLSSVKTLDGYDTGTTATTCSDATLVSGALANGYIDAVCLTFDKAMWDSSILQASFTVSGSETVHATPTHTAGTANDAIVVLRFASGSGAGALFTTDGLPVLTRALTTMRDNVHGNYFTAAAPAAVDTAPAAMLSAATGDINSDGTVDRLTVTFSEPVRIRDGNAGDGFAPITLVASTGVATIANENYAATSTSSVVFVVSGTTASMTDLTITPTYNADAVTDKAICDADVSLANCVTNYPSYNQMLTNATVAGTDGAAPVILSAQTTSDRNISLTFSESVSGAAAGDLHTNGGLVAFSAVSGASGSTIVWQTAGTPWNTDAYDTSAGSGTDSTGTARSTIVNLTMAAGSVQDSSANLIAVVNNSAITTDGAVPIILSTKYKDDSTNGSVDRLELTFSETVTDNGLALTQYLVTANGLTGFAGTPSAVSGSGSTVLTYTVSATSNLTGASSAPTLAYTAGVTAVNRVRDAAATPNDLVDFAGTVIVDTAAPVAVSALTLDNNNDGTIDYVKTLYSESLTDSTVAAADFRVYIVSAVDGSLLESFASLTPSSGNVTDTANDATIYIGVTSGSETISTNKTDYALYVQQTGPVSDTASSPNTLASFSAGLSTDGSAAIIISAATGDVNADGSLDRLVLTFSESVTVTDGGTDDDITLVASTGTAAITAGAYGTTASTLTYVITTSATGNTSLTIDPTYATAGTGSIIDAALVEMLNGETVVGTDAAAPTILVAATGDNDADGSIDRVVLTFSESVTVTDGGTDDDITLVASTGTAAITAGAYGTTASTLTYVITTSATGNTSLTIDPTYATAGTGSIIDAALVEMLNGETVVGTDAAAPIALSATYKDVTVVNGRVDRVDIVFSENIVSDGYNASDYTPSTPGTVVVLTEESAIETSTTDLRITALGAVDVTGGGTTPAITYTNNFANTTRGLNDASNNAVATFTIAATDAAAPILLSAHTTSDRAIELTFSEAISNTGLGAADLKTDSDADTMEAVSGGGTATITWSATTAANFWNTNATGLLAGSDSTDATNTARANVPNISIAAATITDTASVPNGIAIITNSTITTDGAAPVVVLQTPTSGAGGVSISTDLVAKFSEPITTGSVTTSTFTLAPTAGTLSFAWNGASTQVTASHSSDFTRSRLYTITLAGTIASSAVGDPALTATSSWTFTSQSGGSGGGGGGGGGGGAAPPLVTSCALQLPNGGETMTGGGVQSIAWSSAANNVILSYSVNGGLTYGMLASALPGSGSYAWTIPNTATTDGRVKVECRDVTGATIASDTSDSSFTITVVAELPITTPPITVSPRGFLTLDEANAKFPVGLPVDSLVKLADDGNPKTTVDTVVYYLGLDGKRHPFSSGQVFLTWYADFKEVKIISANDLASISLGAPVLVRPGTYWVKIQSDPKTYYVDANGYTLHWITDETTAVQLGGTNWNKGIVDVEPTFFFKYQVGDPITLKDLESHWPIGALLQVPGEKTTWYITETGRRPVTSSAAFYANRFQMKFIEVIGNPNWQRLAIESPIIGFEEKLFTLQH